MNFKDEAAALQPYIQDQRRWLHEHPEVTFAEKNTTEHIARELEQMGIEVQRFSDYYGCIGIIKCGKPGKTILLRGDIDALQITEEVNLEFKSQNDGVMHACGHDCHTAMLLGAAKLLSAHKEELQGTVKLLFQAAEECGHGSIYYIEHGCLDNVDAAFAMHVMNELSEGTFSIENGPRMASCTNFTLTVQGVSAHGSTPHLGKDAIVAASAIILNIQTLVSRFNNPLQPLVVTIGSVKAGKQFNIISDHVEMTGTIRCFDNALYDEVPKMLENMAKGTAEAMGCSISFDVDTREMSATNAYPELTAVAQSAAAKLYGETVLGTMKQKMGSEDFAFIMEKVPSVLAFMGYHNDECGAVEPLHSCRFYLDDSYLHKGAALHAQFAFDFLAGEGK